MDSKSITRRDVQQLVKDGQIGKAIELFEEEISGGAGAPFDFVCLGDLCIRDDRTQEAVAHYEEAIAGYNRLGFHRNAVALWRKILRLDSSRLDAFARMGDAYAAEQLVGDALHAYFVYLERAWESQHETEAFATVVKHVEELAPQRAEYAIRLSEFLVQSDQPECAAAVLARAAEIASAAGVPELAADLRERAQRLEPQTDVESSAEETAMSEAGDAGAVEEVGFEPGLPDPAGPLHYGEIDLESSPPTPPVMKEPVDREGIRADHHAIEACLEAERPEEALALCDEAARAPELTPRASAELGHWRSLALSGLGRRGEAIEEMRRALRDAGTDPGAARWAYELARELDAAGELDEARALLREAVDRDPELTDAAELLSALEQGAA